MGLVSTLICEFVKLDEAYELKTESFRMFLAKFMASICMHL